MTIKLMCVCMCVILQQTLQVLLLKICGEPDPILSDLWKNTLVKQKPKALVVYNVL